MMSLATDLDHLEKHIDWYGSVTVKSPDIWGQQRLTRYREEFEREMVKELDQFELTLQGAQARSDQAMASFALSLGIAIQDPVKTTAAPSATSGPRYADPPIVIKSRESTEDILDANGKKIGSRTVNEGPADPVPLPPPSPPPAKIEAPTAVDASSLVKKDPNFSTTDAKLERIGFDPNLKKNGIGLEPTEFLNQKQRYLNHLAQIRRNNEGDDTADSPGYSLNLIRLPVSVLPGKRTDRSHGAEVTITIEPVLTSELLPSTFRNFVMNDLVKELGFPLTKFLDGDVSKLLIDDNRLVARSWTQLETIASKLTNNHSVDKDIQALPAALQTRLNVTNDEIGEAKRTELTKLVSDPIDLKALAGKSNLEIYALDGTDEISKKIIGTKKNVNIDSKAKSTAQNIKLNRLIENVDKITASVRAVNLPYSTGTRNKQALPYSQFFEVYGAAFPFEIAFQANRALGQTIKEQGYAHLPDIQAYLAQELDAAYRLLKEPDNADLWVEFCKKELVTMIRTRNAVSLDSERTRFREMMRKKAGVSYAEGNTERQSQFSCTVACAWAIIVQSALLNDRMMLDMKETATQQHCEPFCTEEWVGYYLPCPRADERESFNRYVKQRWPIKVFALDPINDEQNLADSLSTRRETQLALAIAFKSSRINGSTFNKFARRLEAEYETIDLNRTQIGFGHGENTFGWRFYPRFQTPPTRSNATVLLRDQLIGGPNKNMLLRERRLEPGMRECTALVIMPSFVPQVAIETTTNWFGLANPKHKVFDHTQHLHLSRTIKAAQTQGIYLTDANCYRDGDDRRLRNRVEQLANRLPMQSLTAQVPVESNVGGHELFIHGTTDLAPELYGWYGAPGVDQSKVGTSLFLVGNHFSVTQTTVLVGNVRIPRNKYWMISRQVMRVEIPDNAMTFKQADGQAVLNVHVATPYGVSREITIPDISQKPAPTIAAGLPLKTETTVTYAKKSRDDTGGTFDLESKNVSNAVFAQWAGDGAPKEVAVRLTFMFRDCPVAVDLQTLGANKMPEKIIITNEGGVYRIEKAMMDEVVKELFMRVNPFGGFTNDTSPLKDGTWSAKITLIPKDGPAKDAANDVTLKFKCSIP